MLKNECNDTVKPVLTGCRPDVKFLDVAKRFAAMDQAEYAKYSLDEIKKRYSPYSDVYYEFMRDMFSGKDKPTIQECEDTALREFAKNHERYCDIIRGFKECGELYYLDSKDLVIFMIFEVRKSEGKKTGGHKSMCNYNPLNFDVIEQAVPDNMFFEGIESGRYKVSNNEAELEAELWELIYNLKK